MSIHPGFALLIGVDDYSSHDASAGNPQGTSDLLGSRNDVLAFFRTCRALDIPAENIRVLTSPKLDVSALPGVAPENVGEATEHAIAKGAAWLADAASAAGGAALLTFSGHGARLAGGQLALCPSDTGARLDRAVPFEAIRAVFEARGALPRLTCLIDACFAGASSTRGAAARAPLDPSAPRERRTLSLGAPFAADDTTTEGPASGTQIVPDPSLTGRVLAASRLDQPAFQASFSGEHRGAFSWAVGAALDQWSTVKDEDGTRLNLSYGELRARAERLLGTLSFDQKPVLHGPENVADLAFFQRGTAPRSTAAEPDARRAPLQIDPGMLVFRKYVFTSNANPVVLLAEVFAMYSTAGSYTAGNEYWNVNRDALRYRASYSLSVTMTEYSSGTPSPTSFTNGQSFVEPINLTWQTMRSDPGSGGTIHANNGRYLRLNDDQQILPTITKVTWYHVLPNGESPANITPQGTFTSESSVSVGGNQTAYYIEYSV